MKNFTRSAAFLLSLLAFTQGANAQSGQMEGDPQAGADKTAICAACHGADGNAVVPMYPKIAGLGEDYIYKQLEEIKTRVRIVPEMTGMLDGFSSQDLRDIAAYYEQQELQLAGAQESQVRLNSGESTAALALGRAIYRFGNPETKVPACAGCHSPTGLGNEPAGYPRIGGQYADYIAKQLRAFRAGERVNDSNQVMRDVAEHMSEAEIIAVSSYIAGLYAGDRNTAAR